MFKGTFAATDDIFLCFEKIRYTVNVSDNLVQIYIIIYYAAIGFIVMEFGTDIHVPESFICNNFCDPLTFNVVNRRSKHPVLCLMIKYQQKSCNSL